MKETPLSELTLRRYEKPNQEGRELIRKLCLSIGLLQSGDSRDVIVDCLHAIIKKNGLSSKEIRTFVINNRTKHKLPKTGIATSNLRRQLRRLKKIHLIETKNNKYYLNENLSFTEIFEEKIKPLILQPTIERILDYCKAVDKLRKDL